MIIYGGKGADIFKYSDFDEGVDLINGFKTSQGDALDVADVLVDAFDPVEDMLSHFVDIERAGDDAILRVDADGQGTEHEMTAIAIIENGKHLDVQELFDDGSLII